MALSAQLLDKIDKLNGNNYRSWKFNMKMALVQRELWDHVTGEAVAPDNDRDENTRFERKEEKALATIALSIEPEHQIHIMDCTKASDAWDILRKIFEPKSRPRILQLKKQMVSIRLEQDETMMSYLSRIKTCSDSLKEAGHEIKDDDLAYTMLCGLPDNYEGIIMALANLDDTKFKSSEIKGILLSEYERRAAKETGNAIERKEAYHQTKEVPNQLRDKKEERKCFRCGKQGHLASNCYSKTQNIRASKRNVAPNQRKHKDTFLLELNNVQVNNSWLIDSGATHHICKHRDWFENYRSIANETIYSAGNDTQNNLKAVGIGDINIKTHVSNNVFEITLHNVYHVPNIRRNLMSVSQIESKQKRFIIDNHKLKIINKRTKMIVGEATCKNGLYIVKATINKNRLNRMEAHIIKNNKLNDSEKWHQRFCHVGITNIQELSNKELVRGLENLEIKNIHCNGCNVAKSVKAPCKNLGTRNTKNVLELVHSDLCGPLPVKSMGGSRYFLTLTDDYSRKTTIYCLKNKSEVSEYIRMYIARVERETDKKVKRLRTDNGLEFCNKDLMTLFNNLGIKHERTNAYTPQMNGVAERINRTLMNLVRAMLKTAKLPEKFWAEALLTACYVKNRVVHTALGDNVPEGVWTGNKPSVKHLKTYGCLAYVHLPTQIKHKLNPRAKKCIFVGYSTQTRGYRLWDPTTDDIVHSKHVEFVEEVYGYEYIYKVGTYGNPYVDIEGEADITNEVETTKEMSKIDNEENCEENGRSNETPKIELNKPKDNISNINVSNSQEAPITETPICESKRGKVIRNPWGCKGKPKNIEINLTEIIEPTTFEQAISLPQSEQWKAAMEEELKNLEDRNTWEVVNRDENIKYIGSKWVYKVKTDSNNKVVRFRARLVAQGYDQKKNVDYFESYAPVANISVIRLLLATSMHQDWKIQHLDIKCAYLYGELTEQIYMELPPGYNDSHTKVAKLKRPIYGLKQSGRNWNSAIDKFLTDNRFQRLKSNNCIYTYDNDLILTIYVDDILLFSKDISKLEQVKKLLMSKYEVRDLGIVSYLLGISISFTEQTMKLSQEKYIQKLINEYGMNECKSAKTPIEPGLKLSKCDSYSNESEIEEMKNVPYRQLVGSLMYIALATRPDIMYAVSKLAQFVSKPSRIHWMQAKRVLRYLYTTKNKTLTYSRGNDEIEIFTDADWAADIDDRHSYSGMVVFIGRNAVIWKSNKQKSISTSTMEAEYVALENAVKEAIWINMMYKELIQSFNINIPCEPYIIRCDNKSAIDFTINRIERSKSKHIDIAYHITREKYEEGLIKLKYVSSSDNVADIFTKALPHNVMYTHIEKLRLY